MQARRGIVTLRRPATKDSQSSLGTDAVGRSRHGTSAYRTALFTVLAVIVAGIAVSMSSAAAHAAPATPTTAANNHQQHTAADPAPLNVWRLEQVYKYRNSTEDHWAQTDCRADAATYMQQGGLDWRCTRNAAQSRWELWIEWAGCPGCRSEESPPS